MSMRIATKRPEEKGFSDRELRSIRLMVKEGYSFKQIGTRFGVDGKSVQKALKDNPQ